MNVKKWRHASVQFCIDTTMNTIRIFKNEPLVSKTQYSNQAVGSISEESGSITDRSGRFSSSVMRPDMLCGPLNFSKGSRMQTGRA